MQYLKVFNIATARLRADPAATLISGSHGDHVEAGDSAEVPNVGGGHVHAMT